MKLNFKISEFTRYPIPPDMADKILQYHILAMNPLREELGVPVIISKKSGYRPEHHERERGREPTSERPWWSEHCFKEQPGSEGWGANDSTTARLGEWARLLAEKSSYSRIVLYPEMKFIHSDYKHIERGKRLYIASPAWKQVSKQTFMETATNISILTT